MESCMLRETMQVMLDGEAEEQRHRAVISGFFAMFGRPGGRSDEDLGIAPPQQVEIVEPPHEGYSRPNFVGGHPTIAAALDLDEPS